jgi:hypothetical protein
MNREWLLEKLDELEQRIKWLEWLLEETNNEENIADVVSSEFDAL